MTIESFWNGYSSISSKILTYIVNTENTIYSSKIINIGESLSIDL